MICTDDPVQSFPVYYFMYMYISEELPLCSHAIASPKTLITSCLFIIPNPIIITHHSSLMINPNTQTPSITLSHNNTSIHKPLSLIKHQIIIPNLAALSLHTTINLLHHPRDLQRLLPFTSMPPPQLL